MTKWELQHLIGEIKDRVKDGRLDEAEDMLDQISQSVSEVEELDD